MAGVRVAALGLIAALDVDESKPLDGQWLHALMKVNDLPLDDPILPFIDPRDETASNTAEVSSVVAIDDEDDEDYNDGTSTRLTNTTRVWQVS